MFAVNGEEYMLLDKRSFGLLLDGRLVTAKPSGCRTWDTHPVEAVRLRTREEVGWIRTAKVVPIELGAMNYELVAIELRRKLHAEGVVLGTQAYGSVSVSQSPALSQKVPIETLGIGEAFVYGGGGDEYMLLSVGAFARLNSAGLASPYKGRDSNLYPVEAVNLTDREETGFRPDFEVTRVATDKLKTAEYAKRLLRALSRFGVELGYQPHGNGAVSGRQQSVKPNPVQRAKAATLAREMKEEMTVSEALYQDRLVAARALPTSVLVRETKKEVDPMTEGDKRVGQARKNAIVTADKALFALQSTQELFRKFGVDAELKEALEKGLKGMEPYLKLRKKGRE